MVRRFPRMQSCSTTYLSDRYGLPGLFMGLTTVNATTALLYFGATFFFSIACYCMYVWTCVYYSFSVVLIKLKKREIKGNRCPLARTCCLPSLCFVNNDRVEKIKLRIDKNTHTHTKERKKTHSFLEEKNLSLK